MISSKERITNGMTCCARSTLFLFLLIGLPCTMNAQTLGIVSSFGASNFFVNPPNSDYRGKVRSGRVATFGFYRTNYTVDSLQLFYGLSVDNYQGFADLRTANRNQNTWMHTTNAFNKTTLNLTLLPLYKTRLLKGNDRISYGIGLSAGIRLDERNRGAVVLWGPDHPREDLSLRSFNMHNDMYAGVRARFTYQFPLANQWLMEVGATGYLGFQNEFTPHYMVTRSCRFACEVGLIRISK